MKQNVVLSILTPVSSKSAKKWERAAQKSKLDEGGPRGGLKIIFYNVIIWVLYPFLPMLKLICMFSRSRNPFCKVLEKQGISFSQKKLFYVILGREGALVDARKTFRSFDVS